MEAVARAMCEMCMEPHHRYSERCAEFENVTSCGEAHEGGVRTDWAAGVEKLQKHLRHKAEESREHHRQLSLRHPHEEEPHALLEHVALALCQMCTEPRHRHLEKCLQYQHV